MIKFPLKDFIGINEHSCAIICVIIDSDEKCLLHCPCPDINETDIGSHHCTFGCKYNQNDKEQNETHILCNNPFWYKIAQKEMKKNYEI